MEKPNIFNYLDHWINDFEAGVNLVANDVIFTSPETKNFYEGYLKGLISNFVKSIKTDITEGEKEIDMEHASYQLLADIDLKFQLFLRSIQVNESNEKLINDLMEKVDRLKRVLKSIFEKLNEAEKMRSNITH